MPSCPTLLFCRRMCSSSHRYAFLPRDACVDPVSLPSGRLEKTTRSSSHHVAQHRPTGSETTPPYTPRSSRFGSEPPSVEDDVDVWRYAIVRVACRKRRRRCMRKRGLCRRVVSCLSVCLSVRHIFSNFFTNW